MGLYDISTEKSSTVLLVRGAGSEVEPERGTAEPGEASLGTTRKSLNPPLCSDVELQLRRAERWALQAASREILGTKAIRGCCRSVIPLRENVDVWKSQDHFHYGGLMTCGSVWVCPVCQSKISTRRSAELVRAFAVNQSQGGSEQLWTFTAPHHLGQSLEFCLDAMTRARGKMLNRKPWKRLAAALKVKGTIRALEVTHSFQNGWHVHFHVLVMIDGVCTKESLPAIESGLYSMWSSACTSCGLDAPTRAHGVSVEDGTQAAKYVGKWGLEHEMTKSHIKRGKEGHYTPTDFLRLHLEGDSRYAALFREFAEAFKGKRQLVWSDGLRDRLGLGAEASDQELAESVEESAAKFAEIPLNAWRLVLKKEKRGELLQVCYLGLDALWEWLICLMDEEGMVGDG